MLARPALRFDVWREFARRSQRLTKAREGYYKTRDYKIKLEDTVWASAPQAMRDDAYDASEAALAALDALRKAHAKEEAARRAMGADPSKAADWQRAMAALVAARATNDRLERACEAATKAVWDAAGDDVVNDLIELIDSIEDVLLQEMIEAEDSFEKFVTRYPQLME
jgi:hypothetical protein